MTDDKVGGADMEHYDIVVCGAGVAGVAAALAAAETQDFIRGQYRILREHCDARDRKTGFPVHLPTMPQVRKIARIDGMEVIADGRQPDANRTLTEK